MNAVRHEDAPPEAPRNRVRFDPTINLGHVLIPSLLLLQVAFSTRFKTQQQTLVGCASLPTST